MDTAQGLREKADVAKVKEDAAVLRARVKKRRLFF